MVLEKSRNELYLMHIAQDLNPSTISYVSKNSIILNCADDYCIPGFQLIQYYMSDANHCILYSHSDIYSKRETAYFTNGNMAPF